MVNRRSLWARHPTRAQVRARWTLVIIWGSLMIAVVIADHMHLTNHP